MLWILTALSVLVCAASIGMWVRSYWAGESVIWKCWEPATLQERERGIRSGRGGLMFWRHWYSWKQLSETAPIRLRPGFETVKWERDPAPSHWVIFVNRPSLWNRMGFDLATSSSVDYQFTRICVPYWCLALIGAMLPGIRIGRWLRRRPRAGLCARCGYDLRATPDRCPECGSVTSGGKS